ncbi:MAG TPA: sugar-binding domain-containing protein [bacterium]|nr:sugar-binding domain-containing protein [bacterium]
MPTQRGFDERLIWQAVMLRYMGETELSHAQIAKKMNIKRIMVTRLLSRAQSEGYVRTIFAPPKDRQLELNLIAKYNLLDAYVAKLNTQELDPKVFLRVIGEAGATCFQNNLKDCVERLEKKVKRIRPVSNPEPLLIGLAGGLTIAAVARALSPGSEYVKVFPLAATLTEIGQFGPESICGSFVSHYSADHASMEPGFYLKAELDETGEKIARFAFVPKAQAEGLMLDMALIGIGATGIKSSTFAQAVALIPDRIREKIFSPANGKTVVGDIAGTLIYEDGSLGDSFGYSENLISVKPDQLRKMYKASNGDTRIIAVAAGLNKVHAIRAALLGGNKVKPDPYFNVLVTDQLTAEELLKP